MNFLSNIQGCFARGSLSVVRSIWMTLKVACAVLVGCWRLGLLDGRKGALAFRRHLLRACSAEYTASLCALCLPAAASLGLRGRARLCQLAVRTRQCGVMVTMEGMMAQLWSKVKLLFCIATHLSERCAAWVFVWVKSTSNTQRGSHSTFAVLISLGTGQRVTRCFTLAVLQSLWQHSWPPP